MIEKGGGMYRWRKGEGGEWLRDESKAEAKLWDRKRMCLLKLNLAPEQANLNLSNHQPPHDPPRGR